MSAGALVARRSWRTSTTAAGAASRRVAGEGIVVGAVAAAVAALPLLEPSGPGNVAPVDAFVVVAVFAVLLWAATSRSRLSFPLALPVGLFVVGGALGAVSGPVPRAGAVALAQDVVLLLWFWSLVNLGRSHERLNALLATWAYASTAWAVVLVGAVATGTRSISGQTESEGVRTALTFGNPNLAANYFVISIMIVWATGRPRRLGPRVAAYAALVVALASTGSNSGIVAVVAGSTVASVLGVYRRAGLVPAVASLALVGMAAFVVGVSFSVDDVQSRAKRSSYAFVRDGVGRSAKTASDRGLLLQQGLHLYRTGGPLGTGPTSTKVRLEQQAAHRAVEAHNDYLAAVNERGVLGLLGVVLLVAALGVYAVFVGGASRSEPRARGLASPNALAGAIVAIFVTMGASELLHARHVWALFGVVVAAAAQARR